MALLSLEEKVAVQVLVKFFRKGNMARCLRDILPSTSLSREQRENVATLVHDIVRWRKLYEYVIEQRGCAPLPEVYVSLALEKVQTAASSYPFDIRYSCSSYVSKILTDHEPWAEYLNQTPPTTLCVNMNTSDNSTVKTLLLKDQLPAEPSILETAILTSSNGKYSTAVQERYAHVQDENSQLISSLACSFGDRILDYCAGNGGKSLAMASMSQNRKNLHAYEVNPARRETLRKRCSEYQAKVTIEDTTPKKVFDVVLVDAPCTGIGAARRNPEVKYTEHPGDFPQMQLRILTEAAEHVDTKGVLIYTVCTITPEETNDVVEQFITQNRLTFSSERIHVYGEYLKRTKHGSFTVIPNGDLFFISVLQKKH
ncbi:MAG: RsmB/NOP family class I SAM-dependent RNA methyltransferase [Methanobacteriota archaeon]